MYVCEEPGAMWEGDVVGNLIVLGYWGLGRVARGWAWDSGAWRVGLGRMESVGLCWGPGFGQRREQHRLQRARARETP